MVMAMQRQNNPVTNSKMNQEGCEGCAKTDCRVNTSSRQGTKQLGIFFAPFFLHLSI